MIGRKLLGLLLILTISACDKSDEGGVTGRGEGTENWWEALPRAAWGEFEKIETNQSWFEVYKIRDDVIAIYEDGQFEEAISYLILGTEKAILFDTGIGIGDMKTVVSQLTTLPIIVVNSHTHYDHVGGNHQFDVVYGTRFEYTKNHMLGRAHDEVKESVGPGWVWKDLPCDFYAY